MKCFPGEWAGVRRHHAERGPADAARPATGGGVMAGQADEGCPQGAHAHTHTSTKAVLDRLARAIGHLSGVRAMVEEGRDCAEVLIQLAAVRSSLAGVCRVILQDHMEHCIITAVETGDTEAVEELNRAIALLLK